MSAVALHDPNTQPQRNLSVIANMANDYGMVPDTFEATLRATVVPRNCTREEFVVFVLVAKRYGLNPLLREIYAIPKKGGGIQPVVGVDGWYHLANDHLQFDGIEFEDIFDDTGKFTGTTCRVWRKDRSRPTVVTEWLAECRMNTEPWQKWERRMTRHKAGIQGIRVALGFSGIVDPDEADRFTQEQYSERGGSPATVHHLQTIDAEPVEQIAPAPIQTVTAEQVAQLTAMADEAGVDHARLCAFFGIADYAEIPAIAFDKVAKAIEAKRRKATQSTSAADNASPAASPAVSNPAGDPPASEHTPAADAGGNTDPLARATAAGRQACRDGVAYDAVPKEFARYKDWGTAWQDGHQAEGELMEAEMNQ